MGKPAHRPSQSTREFVKNSKGDLVRNTAFKSGSKKTTAPRQDRLRPNFATREPAGKQVEVIDRATGQRHRIALPADAFDIAAEDNLIAADGRELPARSLIWPSGYSLVF